VLNRVTENATGAMNHLISKIARMMWRMMMEATASMMIKMIVGPRRHNQIVTDPQ
jgi:hypothetical protein